MEKGSVMPGPLPHPCPALPEDLSAKPNKPSVTARFRTTWFSVSAWPCGCTMSRVWAMPKQVATSVSRAAKCSVGVSDGLRGISRLLTSLDGAASPLFPPVEEAQVKALACETVFQTQQPLSRQSLADLTSRSQTVLGKPISRSTVWRILHTDAIKPWQFAYWIFPRDPHFAEKAERVLDLYAGWWQGKKLSATDCIISSDEKTSIQARIRIHAGSGPGPHRRRRVEFEYERGGALQIPGGVGRSARHGHGTL